MTTCGSRAVASLTRSSAYLPPTSPTGAEVNQCNRFLSAEIDLLRPDAVLFALGGIAHRAVLKAVAAKPKDYAFGHASVHRLPTGRWLVDSYHCSRYNTQTGRLTEAMFISAVCRAKELAGL